MGGYKRLYIKIPDNYSNETRKFIRTVVKILNEREELSPLMEGVIVMLMTCYETFQKASRQIREDDEILTIGKNDAAMAHPAVGIQLKSNQQVLALMKELGLTIKSRKVLDTVERGTDNLSLWEKEDFEN